MSEGKQEHDWAIASSEMALLANCNRDKKKRPSPFVPNDFNPLRKAKREIVHDTREAFAAMKALWCAKEKK